MADRGFRSAGHAGISPVRGRWPRCFFGGKICSAVPRFPPDVPATAPVYEWSRVVWYWYEGWWRGSGGNEGLFPGHKPGQALYVGAASPANKTRDVCPVLFWCWVSVVVAPAVDDGPTSRQRWLDVPCLLGSQSNWQVTQRRPSSLCFYSTLWRRSPYQANDSAIVVAWHWHFPVNRRSCRGIVLMLGQPRRRWTGIKATLGQSIVSARNTMLVQHRPTVTVTVILD